MRLFPCEWTLFQSSDRAADSRSSLEDDRGQYMVEFALSFVVFVLFVTWVIDLGLMIYNHNLFYHGVSVGARQASLGASNEEIRNTVTREVVPNYFPTLLMMAHPDTGVEINPPEEIQRVDGTQVEVRMDSTFGISMLGYQTLTMTVPIQTMALISVDNDRDRDGCKDSLEDSTTSCEGYLNFASTNPQDHDNNGVRDEFYFGGPDDDADSDGIVRENEWARIGYFSSNVTSLAGDTYAILRPNDPSAPTGPTLEYDGNPNWETWFDGDYHAPAIWDDDTEAPPQLFHRELPSFHVDNTTADTTIRTINTAYDRDNDGWEDKYDDFPADPTSH